MEGDAVVEFDAERFGAFGLIAFLIGECEMLEQGLAVGGLVGVVGDEGVATRTREDKAEQCKGLREGCPFKPERRRRGRGAWPRDRGGRRCC